MRRLIMLAGLGALAACGDNFPGQRDAAPPDDAAMDAPPQALAPCLDRPTDLPRPPAGQLTCDLLPPGFSVAARAN